MAAHTVSDAGAASIRKVIDAATADPKSQIPGFVAIAINKSGQEIFSHASGKRGADSKEPMTMDTIFWIASFTKPIAGIACMQLVEQGKLALDDSDLVEKLAPELKNVKLLKGFDEKDPGFGYTFFNPEIRKFGMPIGIEEFSGKYEDLLTPVLFEPGSKFNYGVSTDWAGILVERASGLSLSDYFQKNIFAPLGMKNISFFPTAEMKEKLAYMHSRSPQGNITTREHLLRAPLLCTPEEQSKILNSAGAGCFAQPSEFVKIIATLLNNGVSPHTNTRILKSETVDEMFTNQIPDMPNFGREKMQAATPELVNEVNSLYPQPEDQPQGWGLTFMLTIHEGATGRGRNTGWWAGLPNLFWWADRERGVGGMVASQIIPFGVLVSNAERAKSESKQ
ncbi:hypothetical protein B7494_g7758 [Chlorociboria aeruginascens]|nr:hypothetical protein B7494_g7758 [Chlorociboria aeruginascens]